MDILGGRSIGGLCKAVLLAQLLLFNAIRLLVNPGVNGSEARNRRTLGHKAVATHNLRCGISRGVMRRLGCIGICPAESANHSIGSGALRDRGSIVEKLLKGGRGWER